MDEIKCIICGCEFKTKKEFTKHNKTKTHLYWAKLNKLFDEKVGFIEFLSEPKKKSNNIIIIEDVPLDPSSDNTDFNK
jgi:hypothetical protein